MPEHINSDENGLIYEHQLMAEKKIGRPLKEEEVVHHIDENKTNNSLNNPGNRRNFAVCILRMPT